MKRSKMLDIIENIICNTTHIDVPSYKYLNYVELAKEILETVEKAGMSPPLNHPIQDFQADMIRELDRVYRKWEDE